MTADEMKEYTIANIKKSVYANIERESLKGYFETNIHKRLLIPEMKEELKASGYKICDENDNANYISVLV